MIIMACLKKFTENPIANPAPPPSKNVQHFFFFKIWVVSQKRISVRPPLHQKIYKKNLQQFFFFFFIVVLCNQVRLGQVRLGGCSALWLGYAALRCGQDMWPCTSARICGPVLRLGYGAFRCGQDMWTCAAARISGPALRPLFMLPLRMLGQ